MKIAYLDCLSGISGDMMLGALIDAGASLENIRAKLASFRIEGLEISTEPVQRKGFRALQVKISHPEQHAHPHLHHIEKMIDDSDLSSIEKETALKIFHNLAQAEARVHGSTIEKVHFHEVGAIDSIADIVGVSIAVCELGIEKFFSSAIPTGCGTIKIAHGNVRVPAPATTELLIGCPIEASPVDAELTTPTGAAFIKTFVDEFGPLPSIVLDKIGIGCGSRDFEEQANVFRIILGTADVKSGTQSVDEVVELETNLDDVTGEQIGNCVETLLSAGALDVFGTPIQMKKNRPASKLSVLCRQENVDDLSQIVFLQTRTLGIRKSMKRRTVLNRRTVSVETPFGLVTGVVSCGQEGVEKFSPEFDCCRALAEQDSIGVVEIMDEAVTMFCSRRPL